MAAKGVALRSESIEALRATLAPASQEIAVVAIPLPTLKLLNEAAARRGQTVAQAFSAALALYLASSPVGGSNGT